MRITAIFFFLILAKSVTFGSPYDESVRRIIEQKLTSEFQRPVRLHALVNVDTAQFEKSNMYTQTEVENPYGTLDHCSLFVCGMNFKKDSTRFVVGIFKNNSVIWYSEIPTALDGILCLGEILGVRDLNADGKVELMYQITERGGEGAIWNLWIFSWDGTTGTMINDINQEGMSVISGSYLLPVDYNGDGILEIRDTSNEPNQGFPVVWSWNGSEYGAWPDTPQPGGSFRVRKSSVADVHCSVTKMDSIYQYGYSILNKPESKRRIEDFYISTSGKIISADSLKNFGWTPCLPMPTYPFIHWSSDLNWSTWKQRLLKIGEWWNGFIARSSSLPGIVNFYVQSEQFTSDGNYNTMDDIFNNSTSDVTISPQQMPDPFVPIGFLDTLNFYTIQSRSLGWIKDQSTANKYAIYFTTAKTQLQGNNVNAAKQTLQTVVTNAINDSTAKITSEAYALLRFNTEYVNDHLTAQSVPYIYQIDAVITTINQTQVSGNIGDTAFVNSLNKQLSNARKNIEKGKIIQAVTQMNTVLSRIEKAYNNTTKRQQQGKPLPKSFVLEQGWTTLSQQISQLLQNLQSVGTTIGVPSQFTTIQAAIKAAKAGTTIAVETGTYNEFLTIDDKDSLTLLAMDNATIQGVHIAKSLEITVKGFAIDASGTNKDAVQIEGTDNANITVEANEIKNSSKNGITLGKNNSNTRIVNNVIVNNQKNGIDCSSGTSGAQYIVNNTIVNNGYNGAETASQEELFLVNNIISYNGTAAGTSGGRYGVKRDANATAMEITLLNNIIIGNNGAVNKKNSKDIGNFLQILDGTDSQNITTAGTEGSGIINSSAATQSEVLQTDFHLTQTSIAIDKGTTNFILIPDEDKDGSPRIRRVTIDVGAYEAE